MNSCIINKYAEIIETRRKIENEINELEQDEKIQRYLSLKEENKHLSDEQSYLYRRVKMNEYQKCNHIWVNSKIIYNDMMNNAITRCGCIKCGLDQSVTDRQRGWLTFDEQVMYDFLTQNPTNINIGTDTDINCDLSLAKAIYKRIDEKKHNASAIDKIKYLEYALYKIRDSKVTDERKNNRIKRLGLKKCFRRWDSSDVWSS